MDSHRNFPSDDPDGQGRQPDQGYPNPEWNQPSGDSRYAPVPAPVSVPPSGAVIYGQPATYGAPVQQHGDNPDYGDLQGSVPRAGYPPIGGEPPYVPVADAGGFRSATGAGAAVLAMPVGPRSGEPLPPLPISPGFPAEPGPPPFPAEPVSPAFPAAPAPGAGYAAPTSGLPHLARGGMPQPVGRPPLAGDARPSSGGPVFGDPAEDTQVVGHATEAIDRAALRRPPSGSGQPGGSGQRGDGVYRSRQPGTAVAIVVVTALFELIALRLLAVSFLTSKVQVGGSIASSFLVLGLPMFGFGLYGLLSGAAAAPGAGVRAWLRPPLVYLPVALALFVTAGLAAA